MAGPEWAAPAFGGGAAGIVPLAGTHPSTGLALSPDDTAGLHTQHLGFNRQEQDLFLLPILVVDGGPPTLSSTGTLTVRICGCDDTGTIQSCNTTAFVVSPSLSPGALIALLVCLLILVGECLPRTPRASLTVRPLHRTAPGGRLAEEVLPGGPAAGTATSCPES